MKNQFILCVFCCALFQLTLKGQNTGNVGIGTNTPTARLQVNASSSPSKPSFLILDSINGRGPSIRFQRLGLDSAFSLTAGFGNTESGKGMILSWWDDSLLWVKKDGRLGLGTGNPQARLQINHKSSLSSPSFLVLDSVGGIGPVISMGKEGKKSRIHLFARPGDEPANSVLTLMGDDPYIGGLPDAMKGFHIRGDGRIGLGIADILGRMQINHKSSPSSPSFVILDSLQGRGAGIQFRREALDSSFSITAGFDGNESARGIIFSWWDDSLLWVKKNGRVGLGTGNPQARMQVNHRSTPQSPTFLMLDSLTGGGPSMRFQRLGLDSFFTFSAGFTGPQSQRGMILSWIDDSLLWVKSNGRMGLGTGDPQARMQVNHRSTPQSPTFLMLDSLTGGGPSMRFQRLGLDSFFTFSAGFTGPQSQRGMILSWIDDSLLWVKSNGRMGLGTGDPQARMQVNHRSTPQSPTFLMLDSLTGGGPSMRFQRLGLDSFFTFSAGFDGPASQRGMILSWIDDSLLWVKSNGRMGLGTGDPQARMQVNHRSTPQSPTFLMLDSLTGGGPSMRFQRLGLDSFFTFSAGFDGPASQRGMILSWIDDSLLWVKNDGRMGLGTGNPLGRMQVNHKSGNLYPHFIMLDSIGGAGSIISFRKQGVMKDLKMTGIPGATRADMQFKIDSLIAFTNNRLGLLTEDPQYEIDLNGTVNIGKNLLMAGNGGAAGQVLRSNGAAGPPTWQDPPGIDIDTIAFSAVSGSFTLGAGNSAIINNTTEKYDFGGIHNNATGVTTIPKNGIYLVTAQCSFTTESLESGPFLLKVMVEILNEGSNVVIETLEQTTVLPGGMGVHTSQVLLHGQVQLQAGQKLRVKAGNSKPSGSGNVSARCDQSSIHLL